LMGLFQQSVNSYLQARSRLPYWPNDSSGVNLTF
jgi:hypothetical protein